MTELKDYQKEMNVQSGLSPADLFHHKKKVIIAYLEELDKRVWTRLVDIDENDEELDEVSADEVRKIIIEESRALNNEWNNHREILPEDDKWLEYNGFIQLASLVDGFPIKLVPIMK